MYTTTKLRRGLANPNLFFREANRLYHRRFNYRDYNTDGIDIFREAWDNLLILDACRHDLFERVHDLPGTLESRVSRGSNTVEFMKGNFRGRELHDTVYVTANPQLYRNRDVIDVEFHDVINVWTEEGWDEEDNTVLPETVKKYANQAANKYPNKRLLVHFIQPHYPFVGADTEFDKNHLSESGTDNKSMWNLLMEGELQLDSGRVWELYEDNLRCVLSSIHELIENLEGTSVVTSDHGNMVGERASPFPIREWGHPRGLYLEELITVPWLIYENGNRRIISEQPNGVEQTGPTSDIVEDRLGDLGYV